MGVQRYSIRLSAVILSAFMGLSSLVQADDHAALDFLNRARCANGLPAFQTNSLLVRAADNHARYMAARGDVSSHTEVEGLSEFTGIDCLERVTAVGYPAALCSENLSSGERTWLESAEGLMTAIYHRKGFLDFNMNEIGHAMRSGSQGEGAAPKNYFSYLMGNSVRRSMCEQPSSQFGYQICTDAGKRVEASKFVAGKDALANRGGEFAIYPWAGQPAVWPHFENVEIPDPLPGIQLAGQPISVHFNPIRLKGKRVQVIDFHLLDSKGREVELMPVKDQGSDPLFSAYDFAWFPEQVMAWNAKYLARMIYSIDDETFHKEWSFTTADVPYEHHKQGPRAGVVVVTPDTTHLKLPRTKVYSLVLSPELSSASICRYTVEYIGKLWIEKAAFNVMSLKVPIKATLTLSLCDGREHQIIIDGK